MLGPNRCEVYSQLARKFSTMTMPDFAAYLDSFTATCKRCAHEHDILRGDIPEDRRCTLCKAIDPGFHWHPQVKSWVYTDIERSKELKEQVNRLIGDFFNVEQGSAIPYVEEVNVNIEPGPNRDIITDPEDAERKAIIDYPKDLDSRIRDQYRKKFADTHQVFNTDEENAGVKLMRLFEQQHNISRLVVPDELAPLWGEQAGS
jgi:hypothetical protein